MSSKANPSKKRSQHLKRNPKRKIDNEEAELSEKEVRNTAKKNKSHTKHLSSEGQAKHANLKQVKIATHKRKTWQPLSKSSREHLQTMMESVIIAILSNSIRENEKIQYHLNFLKKRLLQLCETLKVPPKKQQDLTHVSSLLKMERTQHRANEEGLALLQEETDKMVETVESMTGDIHSLKNKVHVLRSEVEEEERKVKQMFQIDREVLSLPELSQKSLKAPILQNEFFRTTNLPVLLMLIYSTGLGLGAAVNSVIGTLPTSSPASRVCVHDDKGNPVSWSVTDQFATMCHG